MSTMTRSGIAYDDVGSAEPALLCLPGWCGNRDVFDPLLARVGRFRRVLSLDLPGHGGSAKPGPDFGIDDVVAAAESVIEEAGITHVVPVALSHAGWAAIEVRRRLGFERVPGLVLLDWMVLGPPPGFSDALGLLQNPASWSQVRGELLHMWVEGVEAPEVHRYVQQMAGYGFEHWSRAGREIARSFAQEHTPFDALGRLAEPHPRTLHVYATPRDEQLLAAQREVAAGNPWLSVNRLEAHSHFPTLEVPDETADVIENFVASLR